MQHISKTLATPIYTLQHQHEILATFLKPLEHPKHTLATYIEPIAARHGRHPELLRRSAWGKLAAWKRRQ
jgi:hypothetical protein